MILFFEKLLERVAAIASIKNALKAMVWRRSLDRLPIYDIINTRAAHCIQSFWSDWKIKKRINALVNIQKHVSLIDSTKLYLEQSIYQNLDDIAAKIHSKNRFIEQSLLFDFSAHNFGVHM